MSSSQSVSPIKVHFCKFLEMVFLLFLVDRGIAFHNFTPSREKEFNKTFSLEAWICQKLKNECSMNEHLLLMQTF